MNLPGGLGGVVAADPRLRVALQLVEGGGDGLPVGFSHPLIAADERRQRNGFGCGEGRIPTGPMLDRLDGVSVCGRVSLPAAMTHQLLAGMRVLAFAQPGKVLRVDRPGKAELARPACPATRPTTVPPCFQ